VFLGIDGGGTYTRVAVVDVNGNILANKKWSGAASVYKDSNAKENVKKAIIGTLADVGYELEDVTALCAGVAGYDAEKDLEWVRELTNIEDMTSRQILVNDAVIAHAGALLGESGIVAIAGTGSIVLGITEQNNHIRNFDFHHYAQSAARFLTYDFVYRVLAGETDESDIEIVSQLLSYFNVKNIAELARMGKDGFEKNSEKRTKLFSEFAQNITAAADGGSHLADAVCQTAAEELVRGIRLVASCFDKKEIRVALTGSVANCNPVKKYIDRYLLNAQNKKYLISESTLSPVLGAVLMAAQSSEGINETQFIQKLIDQDKTGGNLT